MEFSYLPNELITLIAEHLGKADLRTLAIVSRALRDIAEPLLYANLLIRTGPECQRLFETLKHGRCERAASVHNLDLRALYRHEIGLQHLPSILALSLKLRTLTIESPVCNAMRWKGDGNWPVLMELFSRGLRDASSLQTEIGQPRPLQCLRKLTLHWNGPASRYWDTYAMFDALFCSQTLEELCISCANCPDTLDGAAKRRHLIERTPMKRLTLIECNITAKGLLGMLCMPAALEHLSLGENRDHVSSRYSGDSRDHVLLQYSGNRLLEEPAAFFQALRIHSGSLISLHYRPQPRPRRRADDPAQVRDDELSFTAFQKLESIIFEEGCSPLMDLVLSESSRPPRIQSIRFTLEVDEARTSDIEPVAASQRADQKLPLEYEHLVRLADKARTIPPLKNFDIVFPVATWKDGQKITSCLQLNLAELFEENGEIDPDFDDLPEYELDDNDDEEVNEDV
ncbi:hypothetical protein HII31_05997 [Pseudocercospora fuligena]|uniref:F-box domain-containing protein n=1 Tax=Pseudocercospora fuligena TaxID=685502 RepID=A0A8H6VN07_9PEZI|nr:hypothetical protein HII31_05997 [Pseudocercospora fuligena]